MFASINPPKKRKKRKLKKGCRRVAIRVCRKKKRSTKRASSGRGRCKGLSPESCLADYEAMGLRAPRGLIKKVATYAKRRAASAKSAVTRDKNRAAACQTGEMYGWSTVSKSGKKPKWCNGGGGSDRLKTASELGYYSVNGRRRGRAMRKSRKGKRSSGLASFFRMNPPMLAQYLPTAQPQKIAGAVPQIAGLMATQFLTTVLSRFIPYTKRGAGNYFLQAISATLLGKVAGNFMGASIGSAVQNGGYLGTAARLSTDVLSNGIGAITNLGDFDSDVMGTGSQFGFGDFDADVMGTGSQFGFGDFVTPPQVGDASPMVSQAGQYPLPQSVPIPPAEQWTPGGNQTWRPGGNMSWNPHATPFNPGGNQSWKPGASNWNPTAIPPAPVAPPGSAAQKAEVVAQAAQSGQLNDYESNILGSVIGDADDAFETMAGF